MKQALMENYNDLLSRYREESILGSVHGLLDWDMMTKMPPRGINLRADQLALLSGIRHRMATDPEIGKKLERIEQDSGFADFDIIRKRNIHLIRKEYDEQVALPESLVTEMQRQSSIGNDTWRKAKAANDWKLFYPELAKNVELAKRAAAILMNVKKTETPYDALIDIYEPKMTAARIAPLFDELKDGLVPLIAKIKRSQKQPNSDVLRFTVPLDLQQRVAVKLAEAVHYDVISANAGGRIDETEHPFTSGSYDDVRITTHYYEHDFVSSMFSILHEAGHALYEQDLNPEWENQPVGSACSLGIHESQSRIVENIVGRSPEFWHYFLPVLREIVGERLAEINPNDFLRAINAVKPSLIRTEADEVTYSLHVVIRFNIEKALFEDKVSVRDLPELWNQSYQDYLGVTPTNYALGIMQDMHWSEGNFGYFPCYALGNIYDGQFREKMNTDIPGWPQELARGNFTPVKDWLMQNVHSQGNLYDPADLVQRVTGQPVSVKPFLAYLDNKYSGLFGL